MKSAEPNTTDLRGYSTSADSLGELFGKDIGLGALLLKYIYIFYCYYYFY